MPELATRTQTPEQVRAFFDAHRTVRTYQAGTMPPEHLDAILHAAQRAPTDATAQLYSLLRLSDPLLKREVARLTTNPHMASAAETFVICLDVRRVKRILQAAGYTPGDFPAIAVHFGIGDAVLAGQNMLSAAEMLGYQGCWVGGVLNDLPGLLRALHLPPGVLPFAGLTLGLSAEDAPHRPRLPRELVVHDNTYRDASDAELLAGVDVMNPIAARGGKPGNWARLLNAYFGAGGSMEQREGALQAALGQQGLQADQLLPDTPLTVQ